MLDDGDSLFSFELAPFEGEADAALLTALLKTVDLDAEISARSPQVARALGRATPASRRLRPDASSILLIVSLSTAVALSVTGWPSRSTTISTSAPALSAASSLANGQLDEFARVLRLLDLLRRGDRHAGVLQSTSPLARPAFCAGESLSTRTATMPFSAFTFQRFFCL